MVVVVEKNKKTTHLQLHVEYVNDMVESHLQYLSSGSHGRERRERGGGWDLGRRRKNNRCVQVTDF